MTGLAGFPQARRRQLIAHRRRSAADSMQSLTATTLATAAGSSGFVVTGTPASFTDGLYTVSRLQATSTLLDETQGWVAIRLRFGYTRGVPAAASLQVFEWQDDATHFVRGIVNPSSGGFQLTRQGGGGGATFDSAVQNWSQGDTMLVIFRWTATGLSISFNGAAFAAATGNTDIPTLTASLFTIGSTVAPASWIDSTVVAFACGVGPFTSTDAALVNAAGAAVTPASFPQSAMITGFVNGLVPWLAI